MLLSASFLSDVGGVNAYREVPNVKMTEGDTVAVYLQLRDLAVNQAAQGFNPAGRRYIPEAGAMLQIELMALDSAKVVTKYATQPFPQDPSIWMFTIQASDPVKGTRSVKLTLTEGTKVTRGIVQAAILVSSLTGLSK